MVPAPRARRAAASVRGWPVWTLRPVARVYVFAVVGVDLALTLAGLVVAPRVSLIHFGLYLALVGCAVVTVEASRAVREVKGTSTRDMLGVWFLTIAVLFRPGFAFLAPLLVGAYRMVRVRRAFPYRRVFTAASVSLGWGGASVVFHNAPAAIAGPAPRSGVHAAIWLLLAAGCFLVAWVINNALILLAIRLASPELRLRDAIGGRAAWLTDLVELGLAVTVALAVAAAPVVLLAVLPAVVLCQRSLMYAQLITQIRVDAQSGALVPAIWRYEADAEVHRARRTHAPLAIGLAKVDDFASIAGAAGPKAASTVLRAVATMLAEKLPAAAQVGRLHGAEFAMVLPGVTDHEARRLGVRIRDQLAAGPMEVERDGQLDFVVRPTVSVGVAGLTGSRQTVTELIAAADVALGEARASGGNRVSVAAAIPGVARAQAD
jgi:diguanylate cyclase (GGDEF)-like protein